MTEPHNTPASDQGTSRAPARKSYQKPQLQIYGDLAEITKSKNGTTANDGAGAPNMHYTS
jgi:hypothetical protein